MRFLSWAVGIHLGVIVRMGLKKLPLLPARQTIPLNRQLDAFE